MKRPLPFIFTAIRILFIAFGCGAGGDVITFIRQAENLDYMEAVRFLADRVGMQVPETQEDPGLSQLRFSDFGNQPGSRTVFPWGFC